MGGAYGKGFVAALKEYIKTLPIEQQKQIKISLVADFDPYQASGVLNSDIAIEVNIRIIRVFTRLREYALTHKEILLQLSRLEKEVKGNSKDIENIFMVLKELIEKQSRPLPPRNKIGFRRNGEE